MAHIGPSNEKQKAPQLYMCKVKVFQDGGFRLADLTWILALQCLLE